jgi:S-adenosylmethionine:tRNA ribosyltransferase-isomerase
MNRKDFYYYLPQELIAQEPVFPRDSSKLLYLNKNTGEIAHMHFEDIVQKLSEGDVLVVNNSKVIPARLYGKKERTGGRCELLLLRQISNEKWECLAKPGRRLQDGTKCVFGNGKLQAMIIETLEDGNKIVEFEYKGNSFFEVLNEIGEMPLPHYITKKITDNNQYQTVYAKELGSAAAPTAGLHFTEELISKLKEKGIIFVEITLHVGPGTFRPVKADKIENHKMHTEWYSISEDAANAIIKAKQIGKRVIAVGTTSCRTLESAYKKHNSIANCSEETDIFIYPGYNFNVIDGLITNFHLPESTLIMLVSAFAGYENTMNAYKSAVAEKYRFFSFGDAMLIL